MQLLQTLRSVMRFRHIELDGNKRRLARAANVHDLRKIARRRLPRSVFDYIDGGADDELTMLRNERGFGRVEFRPRVLRDVGEVDTSTTLLGRQLAFPLVLAPTGFTRIVTPGGELDVARAAQRAGLPYSLSTLSTRSIEEVAQASAGPKWFQVYVWKDRELVKELLDRASAAGYEAIVITVDTAVVGNRERDVRHGFTIPPKLGLDTILDGILHPSWTWNFVRFEPILFANVIGKSVGDGNDPISLGSYLKQQFDPSISWQDIEWFQKNWQGSIVIKGIQSVEDAQIATRSGIQAIAISNHGGRQLDSAPPAVELVEPIAQAVAGEMEIICDGGIRRGSDIVKALALGANACMMGRPYLYGLAVAGEAGVEFTLNLLQEEVSRTLALIGCTNIADITRELVSIRSDGDNPTTVAR